jgi:hypothetical protein
VLISYVWTPSLDFNAKKSGIGASIDNLMLKGRKGSPILRRGINNPVLKETTQNPIITESIKTKWLRKAYVTNANRKLEVPNPD